MRTLIVDDKELAANAVGNIMKTVDPEGTHDVVLSAEEAFALFSTCRYDVAFLDIELRAGENGINLAQQIAEYQPQMNVIFITGHEEYALAAHGVYASAYVLKPVTERAVREALKHLRYPLQEEPEQKLTLRCFGYFEAWYAGSPVYFSRSKTKELLACLTDARGAMLTTREIAAILYEDEDGTKESLGGVRVFLSDLRHTLTELGCEDVLIRQSNRVGIDQKRVDCDYYRWLAGERAEETEFRGEYMSQYSWSEMTLGGLLGNNY